MLDQSFFHTFVKRTKTIELKKFAVILAGCGVYDGAEIHEATLAMLAIKKAGAEYQCFAPDIAQHHVINHFTGEVMAETRNVLIESARIAHGKSLPLSAFDASAFDAILFPGGFGAAKNLSTFAFEGEAGSVNPEVESAVMAMFAQQKPIAAMCISRVFIAKILEDVKVTIGQDEGTIKTIEAVGATHIQTDHGEVLCDHEKLVFTTPCYMLDADITQIWEGANNLVQAIMEYFKK